MQWSRSDPPFARRSSLARRLLWLSAAFVLTSALLIFSPMLGREWRTWFDQRLSEASLATLALPDQAEGWLKDEVLEQTGTLQISLRHADRRDLVLQAQIVPLPEYEVRPREVGALGAIAQATVSLVRGGSRAVRVIGPSPHQAGLTVDLVVTDRALVRFLRNYALDLLKLSLVISLVSAVLVYLTLWLWLVRPMRRLTERIIAFRKDPEAPARPGSDVPSTRTDEIGEAARELAELETELRAALWQKSRLAALGAAVTKINHDMRGILATALLVSDRLARADDPRVRASAETLLASIERAVSLSTRTLDFARDAPPALSPEPFGLRALVREAAVTAVAAVKHPSGRVVNQVPDDAVLTADPGQMLRVLVNLMRNALEAGARNVTVSADMQAGPQIEVADDAGGIPAAVRETLFRPFARSAKAGGSGLGLAIARDVMRAHGGDVQLLETGPSGTRFQLVFGSPQAAEQAQPERVPVAGR